mgnify:CR=1 FL=1
MKNIYAVVVTYNGEVDISNCLESIIHSTIPVNIIVVDNASSDKTIDIVKRDFSEVKLICLKSNLGFGRANNIGIKDAYDQGANHVLLINQDARVHTNVIEGLVDQQRLNPVLGVLSPLHLDGTGNKVDTLFAEHFSKSANMKEVLSNAFLDGCVPDIYPVEFVNAAIWMLSRVCIEKVGLFNPVFEHYGEDMEYADRVRYHGFKLGVVMRLMAFHNRNQNGTVATPSRYLLQEKALIRYRMSRKSPGTIFNLFSAFTRIFFSKFSTHDSIQIKLKLSLLASLFLSMRNVLSRKEVAYRGVQCFFEDVDRDRKQYLCLD